MGASKIGFKRGRFNKNNSQKPSDNANGFFSPEEELVPNQIVTGLSHMKFLEKPKGH